MQTVTNPEAVVRLQRPRLVNWRKQGDREYGHSCTGD